MGKQITYHVTAPMSGQFLKSRSDRSSLAKMPHRVLQKYPILQWEMAKISPKINKIEIWPKSRPKLINSRNKVIGTIFGECLNYTCGLKILIWPLEVPFFWSKNGGTDSCFTRILFWASFWQILKIAYFRLFFGLFPIVKLKNALGRFRKRLTVGSRF